MQSLRLWKYNGVFLIATGMLHSVIGIALGKDFLWAILKDGLWNTVDKDIYRELAFWFLICGVFIIILGHVLHYYIKNEQKPAPLFVGYYLLGLSVIGCIAMPVSGFWLFIPQAGIILFGASRGSDGR